MRVETPDGSLPVDEGLDSGLPEEEVLEGGRPDDKALIPPAELRAHPRRLCAIPVAAGPVALLFLVASLGLLRALHRPASLSGNIVQGGGNQLPHGEEASEASLLYEMPGQASEARALSKELKTLLGTPSARALEVVDKLLSSGSNHSRTGLPERMEEIAARRLRKSDIDQSKFSDRSAAITECVIDVEQSAAYLLEVVTEIDDALDCKNLTAPHAKQDCAANILWVISNTAWLASYLGLAVNSCTQSLKAVDVVSGAPCEIDVTTITATLTEVGAVATTLKEDCKTGDDRRLTSLEDIINRRNAIERREARVDRQFEEVQCSVDLMQGLGYVVRAVLTMRSIIGSCPDEKIACSANIFNFISCIAWAVEFLMLLSADCPAVNKKDVNCAAQVSDLVAAVTNLIGAAEVVGSDCGPQTAASEKIEEEVTRD